MPSQPPEPNPLAVTYRQHKDSALSALERIERAARNTRAAILANESGVLGILQIGRDQQTAIREAQAMVSFAQAARLAAALHRARGTAGAAEAEAA